MHDEHDSADYERLAEEVRRLLRDVAARFEEFLLELSRPESATSRGEAAEPGGGEGEEENRCCPLCGVLSLLRQHGGSVRSAELPERLSGLLAVLRDVARAGDRGGNGAGATSPEEEHPSADEHASATAEPGTGRAAAERVRPIPVRRVTGSVLGDQT